MSEPARELPSDVDWAIDVIRSIAAEPRLSWLLRKARDDRLRQVAGKTRRLDEEQAVELADAIASLPVLHDYDAVAGCDGWLRAIGRSFPERPLPARLREPLTVIQRRLTASPPSYAPGRKLVRLVGDLLPDDSEPVIDANDDWGALAAPIVVRSPEAQRLVRHAVTATGPKPTCRFTAGARMIADELGEDRFVEAATELLDLLGQPASGNFRTVPGDMFTFQLPWAVPTDRNADVLRGLALTCACVAREDVAATIERAARACMRKLPGIGARSTKVANACLAALAAMPDEVGAAHLVALQNAARKPSQRARLDLALDTAAATAGIDREELDERATPTCGLDVQSATTFEVGRYSARLGLRRPAGVETSWFAADGTALRGRPSGISKAEPQAAKELGRRTRELQHTVAAQRVRLERLLGVGPLWEAARWRERYAGGHPILSMLGQTLIFTSERGADAFTLADGGVPTTATGERRDWPAPDDRIGLWHPALTEGAEVQAWRDRLAGLEMTQPFAQAHREVYLVTAAERDSPFASYRFAELVVRQHQLRALAESRGWECRLQGWYFDGGSPPTLRMPRVGLLVEWPVEPLERDLSHAGISVHVRSGPASFRRLVGAGPVRLDEVPVVAFSEAMRDIDLFATVAGIVADPLFPIGAPDELVEAWRGAAFAEPGPAAVARRGVLERVLPALVIADRLSLDERWLDVRGNLASYRIHLGSGNVMRADGRHLCIVAAGSPGGIWLPFEGDPLLATILSKAFLLARDDRIRDPSIRAQIETPA
jgi:hypothetical protein